MAKYHCNYCQCEILGYRIKCAECSDFDLCLQCFSCSAEIGCHKKDHNYQVLGDFTPSVFDIEKTWSLAEETMLLDAVEQYGFGNWDDVCSHVESRTSAECQDHYFSFYIQGNIGKVTFPTDFTSKVTDHTCIEGGPLSPSITNPPIKVDLSLQEQHDLGYMPLRDDFERDHDNDAETLISELFIQPDDEDIDIAIKLAQVEKYRLRLKERDRRKKVAKEYSLISSASVTGIKPKSQQPKKRISKEEREFQDKTKIFSQLTSSRDHEQFLEHMQKERELKSRIKELMRYRKCGLTLLDDIDTYEDEKFKRDKRKEYARKKLGSSAQIKRASMVSKKAEEKLDILIDEDELRDDEEEEVEPKQMAALPGYDILSERERKLINSIGMTPANYTTIKTCIIKDYVQRRQGMPVKIRYPSGLDKTHRRKIIGFLTDNGWIGVT